MKVPRLGRSTIAVHGLPEPHHEHEPVVAQIMQAAPIVNALGSNSEVLNNP